MNFTANESVPAGGSKDAGMTLIELMVAMIVSLIVLAVLGTIFIGVVRQQVKVNDVTLANSQAQVSITGVQTTVRNASRVRVFDVSGGSGNLLVASSRGSGGGTQRCEGWLYVPASSTRSGALYYRSTPAGGSNAGLVSVSSSNLAGWTAVIYELRQVPKVPSAPGQFEPVFKTAGLLGPVVINLDATRPSANGGNSVVSLTTTVSPLPQSFAPSERCFQ